jgi:hypothetical protein
MGIVLRSNTPEFQPLTQYVVSQSGTPVATRMASSTGTLTWSGGPATYAPATDKTITSIGGRHTAMIAPAPGETFIANTDLRLVASGYDINAFTGGTGQTQCADSVVFYANDTLLATVLSSDNAEYNVFKTRYPLGLAAGTYTFWCRANYANGSIFDSYGVPVTIIAAPTYGTTITLTTDVAATSATLGSGTLTGSSGSRIKVDGAGFSVVGAIAGAVSWQYVDFYNLGDRTTTSDLGINSTSSAAVSVANCRFFNCNTLKFSNSGTSTVAITDSTLPSNSTFSLGQNTDAFSGSLQHDSYPALQFAGNSTGAKTFTGNTVCAGWVEFYSLHWTIGGTTAAATNVCMGPRVGFFFNGATSFDAAVERNFLWHIYYGGWSQGNLLDCGSAGPTVQHNVLVASSWPVRGFTGTFQYNLTIGVDREEGLWWPYPSGTATFHHNLGWVRNSGREACYLSDAATATYRNNTIDCVDNQHGFGVLKMIDGTVTWDSNLVLSSPAPALVITAGTLTADYTAFYDAETGDKYSDARLPTHDVVGNPGLANRQTAPLSFVPSSVLTRATSVASILSDWRGFYTPSAVVIDTGSTGTYGAGNDIGCVGAGTSNASDLFGTIS